jgi:hypothetical protein
MSSNRVSQTELFGNEREEAILQQFRSLLSDITRLVRHATGARTVALHWVNRQREIYVPETHASNRPDVVFKDRIPFGTSFMDSFRDLEEAKWLKIGKDIEAEALSHYYDRTFTPTGYVFLQPFRSSGETVAITVIETESPEWTPSATEALSAYAASLDNLLHTYLELSNLLDSQKGWLDYDRALDELMRRREAVSIVWDMARLAAELIPYSEVSLILKGYSEWKVMGRFGTQNGTPATIVGTPSMVNEALKSDAAIFSIHINGSPCRVNSRETSATGASIALPVRTSAGTQAVLLVNHSDALSFHDANRHQLANLVRTVGLKLDSIVRSTKGDPFNAVNGAIRPELADAIIELELDRLRESESGSDIHAWVGYATPADYSAIRTRLSPDELKEFHRNILNQLALNDNGISTLVMYHADHIHGFLVFGKEEEDIQKWGAVLNKRIAKSVRTGSLDIIPVLHLSAVKLRPGFDDAYAVHEHARKALSQIVRRAETGLQIIDPQRE